ncbi:hypothetical protein BGW36DRAFT_17333 [Talaromyces proteolyticus]|uniref:Uncharacterized protein n=1 Tax=Talaromyces proteolyticus TaxID=1131652 RepID=A0AAD4Q427_9EURO|nr:uncharacterized protein BGW36DRAFT_17333 [Talaromyces proteolyticus]KAH8705714.1 hypothetical protein BGW36DRAFT_17333 [Talaromyces proteolyticus]
MEPGGESTQYESIRTVTQTPPKQKGQLGEYQKNTVSELRILSGGDKDNEDDIQRDSNLNDPQFLGTTTSVSGEVDKDLKPDANGGEEETRRSRTVQKLGPESGIGA